MTMTFQNFFTNSLLQYLFAQARKLEHGKNTCSEKFGFKKKQNKKLSNLHLFKSRTLAHH